MLEQNMIYQGDCLDVMAGIDDGAIDLTVTSPPYDNLRSYNGNIADWNEQVWKDVILELFRVTKQGGVVVWVVGDATVNGSETGTSFKQALWAKDCGFNLHDTMIWNKSNPTPVDQRIHRYTASYEYMFVLSKGTPAHGELVTTICKNSGTIRGFSEHASQLKRDGTKRVDRAVKRAGNLIKNTKILDNVWIFPLPNNRTGHPAVFPEDIAQKHIRSWSDIGDIVLDPFAGSGTTGLACLNSNRNFILIEKEPEYCEIARERMALWGIPIIEKEETNENRQNRNKPSPKPALRAGRSL